MGKPKQICKKVDTIEDNQKCVFCKTSEVDEIKYGAVYVYKNITTHYFCLLLSSNMEQNGRDDDGILGFLANDINKEVKRGVRLHCTFCKSGGATLGCAIAKCRVVFHLPCGMKQGTLHQFFGEFKSFCAKHRPVQKICPKILAESSKGAICGICYEKVIPRPIHETLWAPCCQKNAFFHRDCVQRLAISAGYFFKCPLCNNTTAFQQAMKDYGVYIPEQDASWECVPQAYQDLLVRHDTCDSAKCICPSGRKTNVSGTRWELILCKYCGSKGIHIGCGRLKWKSPKFECDDCSGTANEQPEGNTRNYNGNRHRISGRTAVMHPSVSADREAESDYSSGDDTKVTISNSASKRIKVVSPLPSPKEKSTSPPPTKKSKFEMVKKKAACSTVVRDPGETHESDKSDSSDPILVVDDSDEDIEVVSLSNNDSGFVKDRDGRTIPVVQVKGKQKRPRAENDVQILPDEIVDITSQRHGHSRLSKSITPPPMEEMVYSLRPSQPSTSNYLSQPSTSFAPPPDLNRFVLVDPSTLRPEDLPPGTMLYRSVRPVMNVPQPQIPSTVPMQQLGLSNDAVTKHPDISEHRGRVLEHNCPQHIGQCPKKLSRSDKCNCAGRRRRRRCDINRLNPQVMLSPLQFRRLENGYYEIVVSKISLDSGSTKRKASSPLHSVVLKKVKISKSSNKKCQDSNIKKNSPVNNIKNISKSVKPSYTNSKKIQPKYHAIKKGTGITGYFMPQKRKIKKKKQHGIVVKWNSGHNMKIHQTNTFAGKSEKSFSLEKCKNTRIDDYLKKITSKVIEDEINCPLNITEHSNDINSLLNDVIDDVIDLAYKSETLNNSDGIINIHRPGSETCLKTDHDLSIIEVSKTSDYYSCTEQSILSNNSTLDNPSEVDVDFIIDDPERSMRISNSSSSVETEIQVAPSKGNNAISNHTLNEDDCNEMESGLINDATGAVIQIVSNLSKNEEIDHCTSSNTIPVSAPIDSAIKLDKNNPYVGEYLKEHSGTCVKELNIDHEPSIDKLMNANNVIESPVHSVYNSESDVLLNDEIIIITSPLKESNVMADLEDDIKDDNSINTEIHLLFNNTENLKTRDLSPTLFESEASAAHCITLENKPLLANKGSSSKCEKHVSKTKNKVFGFFPRIKFSHNPNIVANVSKSIDKYKLSKENNYKNSKHPEKENASYIMKSNKKKSPTSKPIVNNKGVIEHYFFSMKKDSSTSSQSNHSLDKKQENGKCLSFSPSKKEVCANTDNTNPYEKKPLVDLLLNVNSNLYLVNGAQL